MLTSCVLLPVYTMGLDLVLDSFYQNVRMDIEERKPNEVCPIIHEVTCTHVAEENKSKIEGKEVKKTC